MTNFESMQKKVHLWLAISNVSGGKSLLIYCTKAKYVFIILQKIKFTESIFASAVVVAVEVVYVFVWMYLLVFVFVYYYF